MRTYIHLDKVQVKKVLTYYNIMSMWFVCHRKSAPNTGQNRIHQQCMEISMLQLGRKPHIKTLSSEPSPSSRYSMTCPLLFMCTCTLFDFSCMVTIEVGI